MHSCGFLTFFFSNMISGTWGRDKSLLSFGGKRGPLHSSWSLGVPLALLRSRWSHPTRGVLLIGICVWLLEVMNSEFILTKLLQGPAASPILPSIFPDAETLTHMLHSSFHSTVHR